MNVRYWGLYFLSAAMLLRIHVVGQWGCSF